MGRWESWSGCGSISPRLGWPLWRREVQVQVQKVRWWGKEETRIRTRISKKRAGRVMASPRHLAAPVLIQASTMTAKEVITTAGLVKVRRVVPNPKATTTKILSSSAAGAIPKMSRATVDAAVGLVVEDFVGQQAGHVSIVGVTPYTRGEARQGEKGEEDELAEY